jgi:hypothetical protein
MPIGLMTLEDARRILIGLSGQSGSPFCAEEVDWALDLSGPHPFFTQVIGSHLFEAPGSGQLRSTHVYETIRKRFTAEAEDHYRYIWASLDSSEQSGLLALPRTNEALLKALRARSLVREIDGQPMPFSDAFAAFLEREAQGAPISGEQATALHDLTGKTLGSYRVLEPLGRGGMAEVYKGYHPLLDRYVGDQVLLPHLVKDSSFAERFQREAARWRGCGINIVQVHDFGIRRCDLHGDGVRAGSDLERSHDDAAHQRRTPGDERSSDADERTGFGIGPRARQRAGASRCEARKCSAA